MVSENSKKYLGAREFAQQQLKEYKEEHKKYAESEAKRLECPDCADLRAKSNTDDELITAYINRERVLQSKLEAAEKELYEEREEHSKLQARCYEGFPSATDGIFSYDKQLQSQVAVMREALGNIVAIIGELEENADDPESEIMCIAMDAMQSTPAETAERVQGLVEALEHIAEYWNGASESVVDAIEEARNTAGNALASYRGEQKC
jgi:hypothetical protein